MPSATRILPAALVAFALASSSAPAAEQRTTVMLWASALDGTMHIGPATADFDLTVAELLNLLDGSIMLRHDSKGETRGWYAEFFYADLKQPTSGPLGERQANMQQTILELGMSQPIGESWDVYGGARWETVDNSIDFSALPRVTAGTEWADAVLGVRWHKESDGLRWWARGDIAGGGSDGAYLIEAGGALSFAETWGFSFAYRKLNTEFENGNLFLDLEQAGIVFGVSRDW